MPAERRHLLAAAAVLVGAAALVSWFLANFERRTLEIPTGVSAAARRNPYLAAERFLSRLEIPVESRAGRALLLKLPAPTDTLAVGALGALTPARRAALRDWLTQGGRLLVEATTLRADGADPGDLPGELGVRLVALERERGDCPDEALAQIAVGSGAAPLEVSFAPCRALETAAAAAAAVDAGGLTHLVQLPVGAGRVTVVSDSRFMTNAAIGERDHALFLAHLLRPSPGGKVWLLYDSEVPGLAARLWQTVPGALIGAALLIPLWLWSLGARLGPLEPPPERRRRDLMEHLEASGDFLWRRGQSARLAGASRQRVLAAWQRRRPELRRLSPADQAAAIARSLGEPPQALTRALLTPAEGPRAFVDQARRLQALWHGARPPRRPDRRLTPEPNPNERDG